MNLIGYFECACRWGYWRNEFGICEKKNVLKILDHDVHDKVSFKYNHPHVNDYVLVIGERSHLLVLYFLYNVILN